MIVKLGQHYYTIKLLANNLGSTPRHPVWTFGRAHETKSWKSGGCSSTLSPPSLDTPLIALDCVGDIHDSEPVLLQIEVWTCVPFLVARMAGLE